MRNEDRTKTLGFGGPIRAEIASVILARILPFLLCSGARSVGIAQRAHAVPFLVRINGRPDGREKECVAKPVVEAKTLQFVLL
jgi:hypothetical protein